MSNPNYVELRVRVHKNTIAFIEYMATIKKVTRSKIINDMLALATPCIKQIELGASEYSFNSDKPHYRNITYTFNREIAGVYEK